MVTEVASDAIEIVGVVKRFDAFTALNNVSLTIRDNEFFTLLGPSGCGKTTLLRLIAGFETVTSGQILLYGEDIGKLPPNERPVNTVFQHYALFPHMTVRENIAFGLKMRGYGVSEVEKRVNSMLSLVHLTELADRKPHQLSGGQQQRAALARAIAPSPRVLLLDESLSALDLKLRQAMRLELKQLQQETGITFIFVTHDQEEALAMSDRIAVMSQGKIQQTGTAREIYERPINRFVADFIGETNLLEVSLQHEGDEIVYVLSNGVQLNCSGPAPADAIGGRRYVLIRPEQIKLASPDANGLPAVVSQTVYLGTDTQYIVRLDGNLDLTVRVQNAESESERFDPGSVVSVHIGAGATRLLQD